jgi:hypothetical protein
VQDLNAQRVVLEVWGTTAQVEAEGEKYHEAAIGYVVVPIRFHEFASAEPPGAFVVPRRVKSLATLDDLVRLVDQAGALSAYAAVGAGTRLLRSLEYDKARAQLCKAQTLLEALDTGPGGPNASLLGYVRRLASDTVAAARADANYRGPLKALPVSILSTCPRGGQPWPLAGRLALAAYPADREPLVCGHQRVVLGARSLSGADVNVFVPVPPGGPASRRSATSWRHSCGRSCCSPSRGSAASPMQLRNDEGRTVEGVTSRLLGTLGGATDIVKPGRGLVLVWGRVFREGDTLLLQSFVQFLRRDVDESVDLRIGGQPFSARLSSQAFACLPRRIAMADMESIRAQFALG